MALIECPECGEKMSEYSYKCLKCGSVNVNKKEFNNIDITDKEYESKYFSHARVLLERQKESRKKKKILFCVILASIILITSIVITMKIIKMNNQIKEDKEKFSVLIDTIGVEKDEEDNTFYVSEKACNYLNDSMTLFDEIKGVADFEATTEDNVSNKIIAVNFSPEDDISYKEFKQILRELQKIYGKYDSYNEDTIYNTYTWNTDGLKISVTSGFDSYYNDSETSNFKIEWRSNN